MRVTSAADAVAADGVGGRMISASAVMEEYSRRRNEVMLALHG